MIGDEYLHIHKKMEIKLNDFFAKDTISQMIKNMDVIVYSFDIFQSLPLVAIF